MNAKRNLKDLLQGLDQLEIKLGEDLTRFSSIRLKAQGDLIVVKSQEDLGELLRRFHGENLSFRMLGLGSNQILPEKSSVPLVKLNFPFDRQYLDESRDLYELPASVPLGMLTAHAMKFGLKGWEVFTGIPANLGGAVYMNAGTGLGEIGILVKKVELYSRKGEKKTITMNGGPGAYFAYRKNLFCEEGEVITRVWLGHHGLSPEISSIIRNYLNTRGRTQPLDKHTCGCVFKNLDSRCLAGKFLDILGLKGLEYKGTRISPVHANFMENFGGSTASDFLEFVSLVQKELELQYGLTFELEVKL